VAAAALFGVLERLSGNSSFGGPAAKARTGRSADVHALMFVRAAAAYSGHTGCNAIIVHANVFENSVAASVSHKIR
jgi:hypothetical protein